MKKNEKNGVENKDNYEEEVEWLKELLPSTNCRYWCVVSNPNDWDMQPEAVGTVTTYAPFIMQDTPKRQQVAFREAKRGDIVLGYKTQAIPSSVGAGCMVAMYVVLGNHEGHLDFLKVMNFKSPFLTCSEIKPILGKAFCCSSMREMDSLSFVKLIQMQKRKKVMSESEFQAVMTNVSSLRGPRTCGNFQLNPLVESPKVPFPMGFNTICYVESVENQELNKLVKQAFAAMRKMKQSDDRLKLYHFQYLTQDELQADKLRSLVGPTEELSSYAVDYAIEYMREFFHATTGGLLVGRQYADNDDETGNGHFVTLPLLYDNNPQSALRTFVLFIIGDNFKRIAGITYQQYLTLKNRPPRRIYSRSSSRGDGPFTLSLMVREEHAMYEYFNHEELEIIRKVSKLKDKEYPEMSVPEILRELADSVENSDKNSQQCKISVDTNGDIFMNTGKQSILCNFSNSQEAQALYILFLRQVERANGDSKAKRILGSDIEKYYKEELLEIYKKIAVTRSLKACQNTIYSSCESWSDISNYMSRIRKFFKKKFNLKAIRKNYNKCYSIEFVDGIKGLRGYYALDLDENDFDLGDFSIKKL